MRTQRLFRQFCFVALFLFWLGAAIRIYVISGSTSTWALATAPWIGLLAVYGWTFYCLEVRKRKQEAAALDQPCHPK